MSYSSNLKHWLSLTFVALSFCSCIYTEFPLISVEDRANIGNALHALYHNKQYLISHVE